MRVRLVVSVAVLTTVVFPIGTAGAAPSDGVLTSKAPYITLASGIPSGASVTAIISVGEIVDGVKFEGIPDGIGIRPGAERRTVDVYVNHEQSTVPFDPDGSGPRPPEADFQDSSVTKLTLATRGGPDQGAVLDASVAIGPENGFLRFCSASMAGPRQGLSSYVFFTGEETNDVVNGVQRGFAVVLDTDTGNFTAVPGLGRLNHENTVLVPGRWDGLAMLTTDDTFTPPTSQLYMYRVANQSDLFADEGTLYALRITHANGRRVNPTDPFNGANDYLDLSVGEKFKGEFIPVPPDIARGDQTALENWSNENNVFQSIRLEDLAYDPDNPDVVYIADTGATRIVPDDATGRMRRGPTGTVGQADNGRIFRLVLEEDDPTIVERLTVLADGDATGTQAFVPFHAPDNVDFSERSFMVQEDFANARIWQYRLNQKSWRVVATVNDTGGESSGIVDASNWFGEGTWLLDVQAHSTFIDTAGTNPLIKREDGQLMLLRIPGS